MNICVLQGVVVGDPLVKELPSGLTALTFDVQTEVNGKTQPSVPVEWTGPASKVPNVVANLPVAVTGATARRFFRARGSVQTRVYVKPDKIVIRQPSRQRAVLGKYLRSGLEHLDR